MTAQTDDKARRIVVGVDGSDSSKQALLWAVAIAHAIGASVDVVATWKLPTVSGWEGVIDGWDPQTDTERMLAETVEEVLPNGWPAGMNVIACEGDAASVLIECARDANMLIVGSRGHGGFAGLLLGSVSAKCAEHGSCPVLVIHGDSRVPSLHG